MLLALGRPDEAVAEFRTSSSRRMPKHRAIFLRLATAYVRAGHKVEGIRWATDARQLALEHKDTALAAAIERDLATLR